MKTRTLAISILLLAIVLAPMAMAADEPAPRGPRGPRGGQGGPGQVRGGYGGRGDMMGRMAEQLGLTDVQQEKIKAIQEASRPKIQEAQEAIRKAQGTLQEAIENGTDADIIAAGKAIGEAYGKQGIARAQTQREINEVLTPEQQAKMKELRSQMKERMQQRRQEGQPGGRGRGGEPGRGGRSGRGGQRPPQD